MRPHSLLTGPLVMAATTYGVGYWIQTAGMAETRLSYDALGGPAAWVMYALVVGLGILHLSFDLLVHLAKGTHRTARPVRIAATPTWGPPARTISMARTEGASLPPGPSFVRFRRHASAPVATPDP